VISFASFPGSACFILTTEVYFVGGRLFMLLSLNFQ